MNNELTGRELDAEIAERCFGLTVYAGFWDYPDSITALSYILPFATDMAAAWQVVEWIRERTGVFSLDWDVELQQWEAGAFWIDGIGEGPTARAPTPAEAICRAALELARREAQS